MMKNVLSFLLIFPLFCCKPKKEPIDFLLQNRPDTLPVIFAPDLVSKSGRLEHGISFAPDEKELVFGILHPETFEGEIHYAKKEEGSWTDPALFEPLKGESVFLPYFTPDGLSLLYAKSNPDAAPYVTDIWMLHKNAKGWSQTEQMNHPISSLSREASASMSLDGTLYFSSNRTGNGLADLYASPTDGEGYAKADRITELSTARDEESIFVSPDGTYLIFSRYVSDKNGPDLLISYRDSNGQWTQPRLLHSPINTPNWERRPFISPDHKFLFFTRMQFDEKGLVESDIYWVGTANLFHPFVFHPIAEQRIKIGRETILTIPADYFKDIDQENPRLDFDNVSVSWARFDREKMVLILNPETAGTFDLTFTAIDTLNNKTVDTIKIIVE